MSSFYDFDVILQQLFDRLKRQYIELFTSSVDDIEAWAYCQF